MLKSQQRRCSTSTSFHRKKHNIPFSAYQAQAGDCGLVAATLSCSALPFTVLNKFSPLDTLILAPPLHEIPFLLFFFLLFFYQIRFDYVHNITDETFFSTEENTSIKIPA